MDNVMNMKFLGYLVSTFCVACIVVCLGCGQPADSESNASAGKAIPKMSFHKPRNFGFAVERLRKLNDLLVAEGELPTPVTYVVEEVNHTHGEGNAHVHYNLVKGSPELESIACECEDHEHSDSHERHDDKDPFAPQPEQHTIRVDIFTELADIAKWLPSIASDSDMSADDWKTVKSSAEELGNKLELLPAGSDEDKRQKYQELAEEVNAVIGKLEALVKPNAAKIL